MTKFYQQALGAEITAQQTIAGVKVFRLRAGETGLGLFDAAEKRAPGVPHHTFDIEGPSDAQELIKELESKRRSKPMACASMAKVRAIRFTSLIPAATESSFPKTKTRRSNQPANVAVRRLNSKNIYLTS